MTNAEAVHTVPRELLVGITVDAWKLAQAFERLVRRLSPDDGAKYAGQLRYFQRQAADTLASAGLSLISIEGQAFDAGAAASPLNISDFGPDDILVVEQMLEPIIMDANGIVRQGTVLLAKAK
jgi:hypothetical protein